MNKKTGVGWLIIFILIGGIVFVGKSYLDNREEEQVKVISQTNQAKIDDLFVNKKQYYFKETTNIGMINELFDEISDEDKEGKEKLTLIKQDLLVQNQINDLFDRPGLTGDIYRGDVVITDNTTQEEIKHVSQLFEKSQSQKSEWGKSIHSLLTIAELQEEAIRLTEKGIQRYFYSDGSLKEKIRPDAVNDLILTITKIQNKEIQQKWLTFLEKAVSELVNQNLREYTQKYEAEIEIEESEVEDHVMEDLKQTQKQIQAAKKKFEQEKKTTSNSSSDEDSDSDKDDKHKEDKDSDSSVEDEDE